MLREHLKINNKVKRLLRGVPFSLNVLAIVTSVQLFVLAFVLSFVGLKLAKKTGLSFSLLRSLVTGQRIEIDKKGVLLAFLFGIITALSISGIDRFYFGKRIPLVNELNVKLSFNRLMAGILYGGVFEEILMRLFIMSLLVFLFAWLTKHKNGIISSKIYWLAIILASVLFAVGHLPATQMFFGELTSELMLRGLLLNGLGGLFFGYLYWKRGFEYAVLSHMVANTSVQLVFIPMFF